MQTWRDNEFLLGFEFFRVQTPRKDFKIIFNGIFGHQEASCMNGSWVITLIVTDSASRQVQLFLSFVNFRATSLLVSISYIFSTYSAWLVLRTLFLILNICYKRTILVWFLATVMWECSLNQFSISLFVSLFVNWEPQQILWAKKYRIQGQFSESQGTFSSHFASYILGLSVKAIFNIWRLGGFYWTFKTFTGISLEW